MGSSIGSSAAPFGEGWISSFNRSIRVSDGSEPKVIWNVRPDGKIFIYRYVSGTGWSGDSDTSEILIELKGSGGINTGWRVNTSDDEAELYDATGKLLSLTDRRGHTQTLTYSDGSTGPNGGFVLDAQGNPTTTVLPAGLMLRVTDASGRALSFGYDANARIVLLLDPESQRITYEYDANNNLSKVNYPDGTSKQYLYGEAAYTSGASLPHALTGIIDENGARYASYWYDSQGRAIKEAHAPDSGLGIDQYQLTYNVDGSGNPVSTAVTNPLNSVFTYNFQTILGVVKSTGVNQPGGAGCGPAANAMTYDANGNIKTRTDFNGNTTWYDYDMARNLETTRIEAQGKAQERTITTEWHATFRLPAKITEPGRVTETTYDDTTGNALVKKITDTASGKSRLWTYTYTTAADGTLPNLLKSVDGPRVDVSDVTTYAYYANGDLQSITNALGHVTQITEYDPHGRPKTLVDPNGLSTALTYTPRGWLATRSVGSETTFYDYDGVGQIKQVTLPSGAVVRYDYDDAHRLTDIWDEENNRIHYTLNAMGSRTKEEVFDAAGILVANKERSFDALNRLYQEIGAVNAATGNRPATTYGYDANGNLTSVQAPGQPVTTHQYDALNRLFQTTDALLGVTQYSYDALDNLRTVTDPRSLVTRYEVNALGEQTQLASPDTGTTNRTYDEAGNLKTSTDARGKQSSYTYDALNRVTAISYSSGNPVSFSYDEGANGKGRLTGMTDESGSTQWQYDPQGRVLVKTQSLGGLTRQISYHYDGAGRLDQIGYPSGKLLSVAYLPNSNKIGALSVDGQPVVNSIAYHPFSGPRQWYFGNNRLVSRAYDQDNRLFAYPLADATRTLRFDDTGRILGIDDSNPARNQAMGYDNLDRLTSWVTLNANQGFGYDANGNRTSLAIGASQYGNSVAADSNRLNSVAGPQAKSYQHDAAGNMTHDGSTTFTYNARGRLESAANALGSTSYLINGLGQRASKSGATSVRFVYDESGKLLGEYDPGGTLIQETVYLGDIPVAVMR
jgi:YD repeat-containing protein